MEGLQSILVGGGVFVAVCVLLAMAFRPGAGIERFTDADADGAPDETPEEKRRALEEDR